MTNSTFARFYLNDFSIAMTELGCFTSFRFRLYHVYWGDRRYRFSIKLLYPQLSPTALQKKFGKMNVSFKNFAHGHPTNKADATSNWMMCEASLVHNDNYFVSIIDYLLYDTEGKRINLWKMTNHGLSMSFVWQDQHAIFSSYSS